MLISCWNIRGLNQPQKRREVDRLIHVLKIDVFGIVETKVRLSNQDMVNNHMISHWQFVTNCQADSVGRIWAGWNPEKIILTVLTITSQLIHVKIESLDLSVAFVASFIYGLHSSQDRRPLWRDLKNCAASAGSLPWISLGDFNVVLNSYEVFGSNLRRDHGAEEFKDRKSVV